MEGKLMLELSQRVSRGSGAALVIVTSVQGSSPGKSASMMGVFDDGTTTGTVGGGNLEFQVTNLALEAIKNNKSCEFDFELQGDKSLGMICGGRIKGYIKVFDQKPKLIIAGGGHLGAALYHLGSFLNMNLVMIDDRQEYANKDLFPEAKEVLCGDIGSILSDYPMDDKSYVVIVTRGHHGDKGALRAVVKKDIPYIGMIGSQAKITGTYKDLIAEGLPKEVFEKVYAPIGLDISTGEPNEIALGIMAEILKVKNKKTANHMKDIKVVRI